MRRPMVVIELADHAAMARDLAAGGVFVPGCTLRLADECELVVCSASRRVALPARVVYIDGQRGAGLELIGFSSAMRQQLADLEPGAEPAPVEDDLALPTACHIELSGAEDPDPVDLAALAPEAEVVDDDLAVPVEDDGDADDHDRTLPVSTGTHASADDDDDDDDDAADAADRLAVPEARDGDEAVPFDAILDADEAADLDAADPADPADPVDPDDAAALAAAVDPDDAADDAPADDGQPAGARAPRNVHERLRGLTLVAQIKLATSGELHERLVLERLYGKNVWETLLRNPRLTPPEVSRIARYGSLPRVLLEIILANGAWLQVPEVRRALLSNPRLGTDQIMKVLRLTPKHELRLAAIQTAYPHAVRNAAKQLLRGD